jgi:Polyketide cyclase / dehydrase and lipid transport
VEDLARYPAWFGAVRRAEPDPSRPGEEGPAWRVDLRGRLGPLARVKRLRMVRTAHEPPSSVRFERHEDDGRAHSPWVLTAEVRAVPGGSRLEVHVHYGGGLFGPVLERLLADEVAKAKPRLLALVSSEAAGD